MAILPPDPRYVFRSEMGCVHSVCFRKTGTLEALLAGTDDGQVFLWDLLSNRELLRFTAGTYACLHLQMNGNEDLLVQQKSGNINVYNTAESNWILDKSFNTHISHYCRFQLQSDSEVFVPLIDSTIGLLSLKTMEIELKLNPNDFPSTNNLGDAMVIKPVRNQSELVLVGYESGQLCLWDYKQRRIVSVLGTVDFPTALDFDFSSKRGVIGGPSGQLQVFTITSSQELKNNRTLPLRNPGVSILKIRQDSKILAAGCWDGRVRIYSWKSLRPLAALDQHRDTVHDVAFSCSRIQAYENKQLMASGAKDGHVALWDIYN